MHENHFTAAGQRAEGEMGWGGGLVKNDPWP